MPGLNIIVAVADDRRFYAALETAMAVAALGRSVRLFLQCEAAALLRTPVAFSGDAARKASGQPDLAWMVEEAIATGIELLVCQSGMALAEVAMADLVPHVRAAGLVSFMANIGDDDRLVVY